MEQNSSSEKLTECYTSDDTSDAPPSSLQAVASLLPAISASTLMPGNTPDYATIKRSNSCSESKIFCPIFSSDRILKLKKRVENAVRERKVFAVRGNWSVIRYELIKRNWVEKMEKSIIKSKSSTNLSLHSALTPLTGGVTINGNTPTTTCYSNKTEELLNNLPHKNDWESHASYADKCERVIMSRMLQHCEIDFFWGLRKDHVSDMHRANTSTLMNRFNRTLFASKEGLALLLQQHSSWYTEPDVADISFPRCYVLGFPDHYSHFVDDFRATACISLLKWYIEQHKNNRLNDLISPNGCVPLSVFHFAVSRAQELVDKHKHLDIDHDDQTVTAENWNEFLVQYYQLVHNHVMILVVGNINYENSRNPVQELYDKILPLLKDLYHMNPDIQVDGFRNIWILKPGNKCRGRGIQLIKNVRDVEKVMGQKVKYVVQKYIERPLLIYKTKFDIRQWFIVSNTQPLVVWMYRECYLRFSTQIFNLENFHESYHLTNHAVQCKYTNMKQRDKALPKENMWDCHTFQSYLKEIGQKDKWSQLIFPGMRQAIICAMLSSQDVMDKRPNTFELYGADFIIDDHYRPWLLEINCCPDMSSSTNVTSRMCRKCMEDVIKVIIDRRLDPNADTGLFDIIYRQNLPRIPPYLGTNLLIRGKKVFKKQPNKTQQNCRQAPSKEPILSYHKTPSRIIRETVSTKYHYIQPSIDLGPYKGPVIEDLIDQLKINMHPFHMVDTAVSSNTTPLKTIIGKQIFVKSNNFKQPKCKRARKTADHKPKSP